MSISAYACSPQQRDSDRQARTPTNYETLQHFSSGPGLLQCNGGVTVASRLATCHKLNFEKSEEVDFIRFIINKAMQIKGSVSDKAASSRAVETCIAFIELAGPICVGDRSQVRSPAIYRLSRTGKPVLRRNSKALVD